MAVLLAAIEDAFHRIEIIGRGNVDAADAILRLAALNPRERDVLDGLVRCQPNKITAHELGISTRTVEVHRSNLMHKLKVRSLLDVLRLSFAAGLATTHTKGANGLRSLRTDNGRRKGEAGDHHHEDPPCRFTVRCFPPN